MSSYYTTRYINETIFNPPCVKQIHLQAILVHFKGMHWSPGRPSHDLIVISISQHFITFTPTVCKKCVDPIVRLCIFRFKNKFVDAP